MEKPFKHNLFASQNHETINGLERQKSAKSFNDKALLGHACLVFYYLPSLGKMVHSVRGQACISTSVIRGLVAVIGLSPISVIADDRAVASWHHSYNEIMAQQPQLMATPSPKPPSSQSEDINEKKILDLQASIQSSLSKIESLYHTNQAFSITFIVTGITLTLIATSLGAVESQNAEVQRWTKFAIVGLGAAAVAAQSLNAAFPVTKKAAEFSDIYWNLKALQNDVDNVRTVDDYIPISNQYSELLKRVGKTESSLEQQKKD